MQSRLFRPVGIALFAFFAVQTSVSAQGGFVAPPGSAPTAAGTVAEARTARDDAPVQLRGNILRALGDEKYVFRDQTGEIVVEIDDDIWRGQTVGPKDTVEIRGEVDKDFRLSGESIEIEVEHLKKL